ncbi:DUF4209 domain-containing protein [Flaviflexus equikiangi]|uniref:DUF4209 domain-containing protein n=1 Tax=Flaviflexus equikiangi TaxID=2758573 RepID=A0ABS2TG84_9ACTO|nr:DUF4209 domain-containing protein [Flaviflexus equikiangi]MBM9432284.1 DUF4209 domain-containing protein [Flaviflexus equikiangi]
MDLFSDDCVISAFSKSEGGLGVLAYAIGEVAAAFGDSKEGTLLVNISAIALMSVDINDWNNGYKPGMVFRDRRSLYYGDLEAGDLELLAEIRGRVPNIAMQARIADVLALKSSGRKRAQYFQEHLDLLLQTAQTGGDWFDDPGVWDRAIETAKRFGKATRQQLTDITHVLVAAVREAFLRNDYLPEAASLLLKHKLAKDEAGDIANGFVAVADSGALAFEQIVFARQLAADWFIYAGDEESANRCRALIIEGFMEHAKALSTSEDCRPERVEHLYSEAYRILKSMPRTERTRLGLEDLENRLPLLEHQSGRAVMEGMRAIKSEPIDIAGTAKDSRQAMSGLSKEVVLHKLAERPVSIEFAETQAIAKELLSGAQLAALLPFRIYSDGIVVATHEALGGQQIYGEDPAVWRTMLDYVDWYVDLMTRAEILPAYHQIALEHQLTLTDFHELTKRMILIPENQEIQYARALYYGYTGDFLSAVQILAPLFESIVRHALQLRGVNTTHKNDGYEDQISLGPLLDKEQVEEIFGKDIVFALRALFTERGYANLRNRSAHGMLIDDEAKGVHSVYAWWFGLWFATRQVQISKDD